MEKRYRLDRLLVATGNQGKYREYQDFFEGLGVELESLAQYDIEEPEETEDSFVGNALLKARYYYMASNIPCLSDDSGLCIPALDGMPGIFSARWAGPNKDFNLAMSKIYDGLKKIGIAAELDFVPAYFVCVIALKIADGHEFTFEGRVDGNIRFPAIGDAGFGYDPIFCPEGYDLRFAEMDPALKAGMSHRNKAVKKLLEFCDKNVAL